MAKRLQAVISIVQQDLCCKADLIVRWRLGWDSDKCGWDEGKVWSISIFVSRIKMYQLVFL